MIFGITTIDPQSGMVGATPEELRDEIVSLAVASNPGLTTNLPGTLIEDIVSTDVAALYLAEQAKIETIASVSPYAANLYILNMLGQIYGVPQGVGFNTSVYVVFSGTPGYVIPKGVLVGDGTHTYITMDASVIDSTGVSVKVYCVATQSGSWAIAPNSVTVFISSVPFGITLTVTNPLAGIPSEGNQTAKSYRSQVLEAGLVNCVGTLQSVKSTLKNVQGVVETLISIRENNYLSYPRWEVIVGGGDPYEVANAIWSSIGDPNSLAPSVMQIVDIQHGTSGHSNIYTNLSTIGFSVGGTIYISGAGGVTGINNTALTITEIYSNYFVVSHTFTGTYTTGGVVSTSATQVVIPRNNTVTIYNTPDSYNITYVIPVQQVTLVAVTWNTSSSTVISSATVSSLAAVPIRDYINSLGPGQEINFYEMQYIFQEAVQSIIPTSLITKINFQVTINGTIVTPTTGTGVVVGDPEGYYFSTTADITFIRG